MKHAALYLIGTSMSLGLLNFPSYALAQKPVMVNVNIERVAHNIAKNIELNVYRIPVSVRVPLEMAATACQIEADTLLKQPEISMQCYAKTTSAELDQWVLQIARNADQ